MTTSTHPTPTVATGPSSETDSRLAFSRYHRQRFRGQAARRIPLMLGVAATLIGLSAGSLHSPRSAEAAGVALDAVQVTAQSSGAPESPHGDETTGGAPSHDPVESAGGPTGSLSDVISEVHGASASGGVEPAAPQHPGSTGEPETEAQAWDIVVAARGHQAEIDACGWVRVDVGAVAPLVGAHNNCGGHIVLDMRVGDHVEVRGEELDGRYEVTEERPAQAGAVAATATAGMTADLIAQTCLWEGQGRLRLLSLIRVKETEPLS